MSDPDDDKEHWFVKFLLIPGPPWEARRHPLYNRGMTIVAAGVLGFGLIAMLLHWIFSK